MLGQTTKLSLQQKLSPRQIQLMNLVQLSVTELEQRLKEELESNPALEEGPSIEEETGGEDALDFDRNEERTYELDEYLQTYIDEDPSSYNQDSERSEPDAARAMAVEQQSFFEYLEEQLAGLDFRNPGERTLADQIVGSIGDDGYLQRKPSAIVDDLLLYHNLDFTQKQVLKMLARIQRFDPPGVGARDLRECLLIQLNLYIEQDEILTDEQLADMVLARQIIQDHFEAFSKKHYDKLVQKLEVDEDELRDALQEILRLNPKPASAFVSSYEESSQAIIPDFIITKENDQLQLSLTARNAPQLRLNDHYQKLLADLRLRRKAEAKTNAADKEAARFIQEKTENARWFIDALQQRYQTLYSVMHQILRYQESFFFSGDDKQLRPMILKDIAVPTGLDISTVSRVANSKFVQTEYGTFSLKSFFSEGMVNTDGEEISTIEVKNVLKEIIGVEDKRKPLNDTKLQKALAEKGYEIARRTVAKYREQLGLPVARLRKEL